MSEENPIIELRPTGQTEASEKLLRETNLSNTEKIIKEKENESESINKEQKKVNSFITILSIWNSMLGSSTVALPYNVYNSGIIPAIVLAIIYGLICFYTCKIYIDFGVKEPDFSITIEKYFTEKFGPKIGKFGKNTQILFCTLITLGVAFIYFLIMSQNLYPIACLILNKIGYDFDAKDLTPAFGRFSIIYLSIILCFILFPLSIKKDIGFIVNLSSFGIYFVSILIIFVIYTGISSLINTEFHFDYINNKNDSDKRYLKWFGENPALLAGTLSLGYFCHTTILPVLKSNKNQKNNIRDLSLGYFLVGLTFSSSGIFGYIGFSGKKFETDFKDNWFMFFDYDDYFILFFRLLNVFQLTSVFPILVYVVRFQLFNFIYGKEYPSKKHVIIYGISVMIISLIVVYFCYNFLGKLLGILGATTSLILIYTFPPIIKMISYYMKLENNNINGEKIGDNKNKEIKEEPEEEEEKENKEEVEEEMNEEKKRNKTDVSINEDIANSETDDNNEKEETDETDKNEKKDNNNKGKYIKLGFKDILYFIGQSIFVLIGIATVVFIFVPINFFNISLKD